jgi:hypothetical protein
MCGAVGWASDAPSREALRGILRDNAKRALDCAFRPPGCAWRAQALRWSWLRSLAPSLAVTHAADICLLVSKRTARARQDASGAMPSLRPFLQSLRSYPKQAGEFFQAQMVLVEKDTQDPKHVIAVLLGLRFGFIRRHLRQLQDIRTYTTQLCNINWRDECTPGLHR